MLFWQMGFVDTFSVIKVCLNFGAQYMIIVGTSAVGNSCSMKTLLEPILGLGTGYQFVMAVKAFERRKRIATLASFLYSFSLQSHNEFCH
jgi:hypothetical protein